MWGSNSGVWDENKGLKTGRMWDLFTKRRVILMVLISTGGGSARCSPLKCVQEILGWSGGV